MNAYLQKVPKDRVKLVTAVVGKPNGSDEHIRCTILVNDRPQCQYQIPHPFGSANEKDFAHAAEYLAPRIPASIRGWNLENGKLYERDDLETRLIDTRPVSVLDLKALVCQTFQVMSSCPGQQILKS